MKFPDPEARFQCGVTLPVLTKEERAAIEARNERREATYEDVVRLMAEIDRLTQSTGSR